MLRLPTVRLVLGLALAAALVAATTAPACAATASESELVSQVRAFRTDNEARILGELVDLLEIPNVAADRANIERNAQHLVTMLERRGVSARILESEGSSPAVFGELPTPGATRTVVVYAHYDGQPVSEDLWVTPPWTPTLRDAPLESGGRVLSLSDPHLPFDGEWRLYARSASDDKAPIVAALTALDALHSAGVAPSVNLKFFFEGEEEAGSSHLRAMLEAHRDLLDADLWLFCDGPVHQSRRQQIVFGVRGVMGLDLTLYGPARALHSGHYGNWAPNPAARLTILLAGMRDADGKILIDGFYDDVRPLTPADREALASVPDVDETLRYELLLAASEADDARLVERILLPALNVRGLRAGEVGAKAKNAIPTEATATLGFRLVPDQSPARVRELVEAHLHALGYHVVHQAPDDATRLAHPRIAFLDWDGGYRAMRTPLDSPAARALLQVADEAAGPVIRMPILGGSLPLFHFEEVLGAPLIVTPMVNHDNNQHAPNENLRLQNLWDGIELYAAFFARLGEVWK